MSEVSDLAFVIDDGVLSESYTVNRTTGSFQLGGWSQTSISIPGWGVVSVATEMDLEMIPEGDRPTGAMVFHSQQQIYETDVTQASTAQTVSDVLVWGGYSWRVLKCWPYPNRNFWKAIAVRLAGA